MKPSGFISLYRSTIDHPVVGVRNPQRFAAWCWMLSAAAYADHEVDVAGRTVTIRRGQFCHSIRFIAEALGWDKDAVARFLTRLKTETMITTDTATGQLIVTICNYDEYQSAQQETATASATPTATAVRQHRDKEEEGNKGTTEETISDEIVVRPPAKPDLIPDAVAAYNEAAKVSGWPQVQKLTPSRRSALNARLAEVGGIDGWRTAIAKAQASDFLCGRSRSRDGPFFASFDFLTRQSSFFKLMEGSYDNRGNAQAGGPGGPTGGNGAPPGRNVGGIAGAALRSRAQREGLDLPFPR